MYLTFPEDPRAKALFNSLNNLYFQFIGDLPLPLTTLAKKKCTFEGTEEEGVFDGVYGLNPVLAGTPWLFWETYKDLPDEIFLQIAEAGMYFVLASILMDHVIDKQCQSQDAMVLLHQAFYSEGLCGYRKLFDSSSQFWVHQSRFEKDHLLGLATEIAVQSNPTILSFDAMTTMSHGKVAPIITTIAALAEASDHPQTLTPIEASLKDIAVASQLLDDVGDWEQDLEAGHMTYYLTQLAPNEAWNSSIKSSREELSKINNKVWLDVDQMMVVIEMLDQSLGAVASVDCPAWIEYVSGYKTRAEKHSVSFTAQHIRKALLPHISG